VTAGAVLAALGVVLLPVVSSWSESIVVAVGLALLCEGAGRHYRERSRPSPAAGLRGAAAVFGALALAVAGYTLAT